MRHICVILLALMVTACSTMTSAERAEREAKHAQAVEKALEERDYTVNIATMYPRGRMAVQLSTDYSLTVKGDTLVSYLPFFGRAYSVPYGGGKGLNFKAPIKEYRQTMGRKDNFLIEFLVDNDEDVITYQLEIFSNGNTSVDVFSREREPISYSGEVETEF